MTNEHNSSKSCPGSRPLLSTQQVDECAEDAIPPTIHVSEYAIGSKWFTNQQYTENFFLTNTFVQDDCQPRQRLVNGVEVNQQVSIESFVKDCAASRATVRAVDVCGNVAQDPIMFLYDDVRPVVTANINVANLDTPLRGVGKQVLVDVGLAVTATDVCTPNPNVTVIVYSDELNTKNVDDWTENMVQLSRIENTPGIVTGWKLLLGAEAFHICNSKAFKCGGTTVEEGNGRVYTIQVCATDEAGLRSCAERKVSVAYKGRPVVDGGKLYALAQDSVTKFRTL